jgi:hypothetical protein
MLSFRHFTAGGRDAHPVQGYSDLRAGNAATSSAGANVPGADWQRKTPAEAGINPQLIALPDLLPGPEARQRWIAFIGGVRYRCTKHRQRSDTG